MKLRPALLVVLWCCCFGLALVQGAVLWVSSSGTGDGPCAFLAPCPLSVAASLATENDTLSLFPGKYEDVSLDFVDGVTIGSANSSAGRCATIIECDPQLTGSGITLRGKRVVIQDLSIRGCAVGVDLENGAEASLNNVAIYLNTDTGIKVSGVGSAVSMTDGYLFGNGALGGGAGLRVLSGASAVLNRVTFDSNSSPVTGGAVLVSGMGSTLVASHSRFKFNTAAQGGAIAFTAGAQGGSSLSQCDFIGNKAAARSGGALSLEGGGITNPLLVDRASFVDNQSNSSSSEGGAVFSSGSSMTVTSSLFSRNRAGLSGGAVALRGSSSVTFSMTAFYRNSALNIPFAGGEGGGAITVAEGSSVIASNGTVNCNTGSGCGGDLLCKGATTLSFGTQPAIPVSLACAGSCAPVVNGVPTPCPATTCDQTGGTCMVNDPPSPAASATIPNSTLCDAFGGDPTIPSLTPTPPPTQPPSATINPLCVLNAPCTCNTDTPPTCTYPFSVTVDGNAPIRDQKVVIQGSLTLRSTSRLEVDWMNTIQVGGTLRIGGSLAVRFTSLPVTGTSSQLFTYTGRVGANFTSLLAEKEFDREECHLISLQSSADLIQLSARADVVENPAFDDECNPVDRGRLILIAVIGAIGVIVLLLVIWLLIVRHRMRKKMRAKVLEILASGGGVSEKLLRDLNVMQESGMQDAESDLWLPVEDSHIRSSVILDDLEEWELEEEDSIPLGVIRTSANIGPPPRTDG